MEKKYIKSAARVLNRNCVNKGGLDLSKEVLWVSVGQRASDLQAIKAGGKKNSANWPDSNLLHPQWTERISKKMRREKRVKMQKVRAYG